MAFGPPEFAASPLVGIDFSWLAVDRDGHVAWLVTGGSAVIPTWVERDPDTFGEAEEALPSLPPRGGAESQDLSSGYIWDWLEAARRGVFGYDWPIYEGPYKLVARPENPIEVTDLPPKLAELARRTRFEHLCFNNAPVIQVGDVAACRPNP